MRMTNTAAALGAAGMAYAVPEVTGVTMTRRENPRVADIGHTLADEGIFRIIPNSAWPMGCQ